MKPTIDSVLLEAGKTLIREVLPATTDTHVQGTLHMLSILLKYSAIDYERGADNRVADITEMRSILIDAAKVIDDRSLAQRLMATAGTRESSLRLSELDRVSDCLKTQFIELHAYVENCEAKWARELERQMLSFLAASLDRNALPGPYGKAGDAIARLPAVGVVPRTRPVLAEEQGTAALAHLEADSLSS